MKKLPIINLDIEFQSNHNLVIMIIPFTRSLLNQMGYQNDFEILSKRFGFSDNHIYTLQEIGSYFGKSRERVRQIEERALKVCD